MRQLSIGTMAVLLVRRSVIAMSAPLLIAIALVTPIPQAAAATAPANDLLVNATSITSLPFSDTIDVSGATSDTDDSAALSPCFPGSTFTINNSVWYSYTTTTDITLGVDLSATDFPTGVVIAETQGGNFGRELCWINSGSNGQYRMQIGAGVTVSILIFNAGPLNAVSNLAVSIYAVTVPTNDTIDGATVIPALPFSNVLDTYLATSDANDVQANATCGQESTNSSVWYVFTAGPHDTSVFFDTTEDGFTYSDFAIIIATGSPGALTTLVCGGAAIAVPTSPGTTYYVLVSVPYGGGRGQRLQLDVSPTPPAPALDARFDDTGEVDQLGVAYLSGDYACTNASFMGVSATQNKRSGSSAEALNCDGNRHGFQITVMDIKYTEDGEELVGRFVPGKMDVQFSGGGACNVLGCASSPLSSQVVKLFMKSPHR